MVLGHVSIPVRGKGIKTDVVETQPEVVENQVSIPVRGKGIKTLPL
ncbi:hypothetical protein [Anabaena sp. FACHB-709]